MKRLIQCDKHLNGLKAEAANYIQSNERIYVLSHFLYKIVTKIFFKYSDMFLLKYIYLFILNRLLGIVNYMFFKTIFVQQKKHVSKFQSGTRSSFDANYVKVEK